MGFESQARRPMPVRRAWPFSRRALSSVRRPTAIGPAPTRSCVPASRDGSVLGPGVLRSGTPRGRGTCHRDSLGRPSVGQGDGSDVRTSRPLTLHMRCSGSSWPSLERSGTLSGSTSLGFGYRVPAEVSIGELTMAARWSAPTPGLRTRRGRHLCRPVRTPQSEELGAIGFWPCLDEEPLLMDALLLRELAVLGAGLALAAPFLWCIPVFAPLWRAYCPAGRGTVRG